MRRKRANQSSWSDTTSLEYARGDLVAIQVPPQTLSEWTWWLLNEVAACIEGIDADVAHGEGWAQAWCGGGRRLMDREMVASIEVAARASREEAEPGWEWLTPAEREIMRLRRAGRTVAEIAAMRHVEISTVYTHLRDARRRLRTRSEASAHEGGEPEKIPNFARKNT